MQINSPLSAKVGSPNTVTFRKLSQIQHLGTQTGHGNKLASSAQYPLCQAIRNLWRDCGAFQEQLPMEVVCKDLLKAFSHCLLVLDARPDYIRRRDGLFECCCHTRVSNLCTVLVCTAAGSVVQYQWLFDISLGNQVLGHGLESIVSVVSVRGGARSRWDMPGPSLPVQ